MRRRTPTRDNAIANAIRALGRENQRLEDERNQACEDLHAERTARLRLHAELTLAADVRAAVDRELRHAGIDTANLNLPAAVQELAARLTVAEAQPARDIRAAGA